MGVYYRLHHESWIRSCLMEITQTVSSSRFHDRGRICGSSWSNKGNCVAPENPGRFADETNVFHSTHDRQHFCNKVGQEPKFPWSNKAHQYKVPSHSTSCSGQNHPSTSLFHKWSNCWHLHQSTWKRKVWKVQIDAWTHQHPFGLKGGMLTPNPMDGCAYVFLYIIYY